MPQMAGCQRILLIGGASQWRPLDQLPERTCSFCNGRVHHSLRGAEGWPFPAKFHTTISWSAVCQILYYLRFLLKLYLCIKVLIKMQLKPKKKRGVCTTHGRYTRAVPHPPWGGTTLSDQDWTLRAHLHYTHSCTSSTLNDALLANQKTNTRFGGEKIKFPLVSICKIQRRLFSRNY